MMPAIWVFTIMYCLGATLYLTILEASDEEGDPNAALRMAFLWPYVAVRVALDRIIYGEDNGEDDQ